MSIFNIFKRKSIPSGHRERIAQLETITDQKKLIEIALADPDGFVRIAAAEKVKDKRVSQTLLKDLVGLKNMDTVRFAAAKRLHDNHLAQSTFTNIAAMGQICWLRLAAAKRIKNKVLAQTFFKAIAENRGFYYKAVREGAVKMLKQKPREDAHESDPHPGDLASPSTLKCPNHNLSMEDGDFDFVVDHNFCKECSNNRDVPESKTPRAE
jgi:hypothetical protein